jgi:hypothetical protein
MSEKGKDEDNWSKGKSPTTSLNQPTCRSKEGQGTDQDRWDALCVTIAKGQATHTMIAMP